MSEEDAKNLWLSTFFWVAENRIDWLEEATAGSLNQSRLKTAIQRRKRELRIGAKSTNR